VDFVIACMRVRVPVASVKLKMTLSKSYKLVLFHVAQIKLYQTAL